MFVSLLLVGVALTGYGYRYEYQTVANDPTKALIYTLPNGLKIYMSVNTDRPRIQTLIGVRVGGKNDPAETTGLAHYFEHLMFKGTEQFGTQDYAAEKPMLDQIEQLFEQYRFTTDSLQRLAIYHKIDSISYQASLIAIPNEYDKLMALIGSEDSNAYTSRDVTCYEENIPSNQIENWAKVQADRLLHPILRGFHTELETIYEEKNMTLTKDMSKCYNKMFELLFPNHPYGQQTVIGSQEHLKNPSITNVKNYHKQWYVSNNMAIVMVGDFDPDNVVDIISKYFSELKPNNNLPKINYSGETPITSPKEADVKGLQSEMEMLAWRLPAAKDPDMLAMDILGNVLYNGSCGLIDLNITQQQELLDAAAFTYELADESAFIVYGHPKEGQTLADVRQILLKQIEQLRNGNFSDELVTAAINNANKDLQEQIEGNTDRAQLILESYINGQEWSDAVNDLQRINSITKADIVAMANKYLGANNYVAINKLEGKDENELKIAKPQITPIAANRDVQSQFVTDIQNSVITPIEPHFVDFKTELSRSKIKDNQVELLYNQNTTNELFEMTFVYEYGSATDRQLRLVSEFPTLLDTPDMTAEEIGTKFYTLGCDYSISSALNRTYITLSGLSKNAKEALALLEHVINNLVPDQDTWDEYAEMLIKGMNNAKLNQSRCFDKLQSYAIYGPKEKNVILRTVYSADELRNLDPKTITDALKKLNNYKHRIIYYGPMAQTEVEQMLEADHHCATTMLDAPQRQEYVPLTTNETVIYLAPYDSKQAYMGMSSCRGDKFDPAKEPYRAMFNEYFTGGMNSIVFQEMRETRSLCYQATGGVGGCDYATDPYVCSTFIATQNDKLIDATEAFLDILNNTPQSRPAFDIAHNSLEAWLRTDRTIKNGIAWYWIKCQNRDLDHDINADTFALLPTMTLDDIVKYQQDNVKDRTYTYYILGNLEDLDLKSLEKYGRLVYLSLSDIFGY
jgi:predicted Zn-dependent peptidase